MVGKRAVAFILLATLAAASVSAAGPSLSFKFYGGMGYWPNGGDFKELFKSTAARWDHVGYSGTFDMDWQPSAYEGGLQAVIGITPRLGLALGMGILNKTINQEHRIQTHPQANLSIDDSYRISTFPITFDAVYAVLADSFKVNLFAGVGIYPTTFDYESQSNSTDLGRPSQPNWTRDLRQSFDSERIWMPGAHFGLGTEFRLSERVFLCVDALFRKASFDGVVGRYEIKDVMAWTGGGSSSVYDLDSAKVWYSESLIWGKLWHYIDFSEMKPTTSDDARLFKFDLSGPVVRIGFRIGI